MKNIPSKPAKVTMKAVEMLTKITVAQKQSDLAKKKAQAAKVVFKRTRKTYKLAKKAAKAARSEVKKLKKSLEAAKAATARSKSAAKKRSPKPIRQETSEIKPVVMNSVLPEKSNVTDSVLTSG